MIDNRKKILSSVFFVCIGAFLLFYSLKFGGTFFNGISKYILVSISLINIIGGVMIGFVRISNVKEINSEKDNGIIEAANDNEAKEPKHVITAEISIEVTGEDEPTKYDKRRERWAVICFWALLAYIISALFLIFVDINVYFCFAFVISTSVCIFSFFKASYIDPEEPTDPCLGITVLFSPYPPFPTAPQNALTHLS